MAALVAFSTITLLAFTGTAAQAGPAPRAVFPQAVSVGGTGSCVSGLFSGCLAPAMKNLSTSPPNCQPFSNGQEWFYATDSVGVAQAATYSNGSTACMVVDYYPQTIVSYGSYAPCFYYFYVPVNGYANANITFGWWDSAGQKHFAAVVPEATTSGWYPLKLDSADDPIAGVQRLSFQDNNGQPAGQYYLGWGVNGSYGIAQQC